MAIRTQAQRERKRRARARYKKRIAAIERESAMLRGMRAAAHAPSTPNLDAITETQPTLIGSLFASVAAGLAEGKKPTPVFHLTRVFDDRSQPVQP